VRQAQQYIAAGDVYQVVLSQRLARQTHAEPFAIYRALRRLNPSPYMFFFDFPPPDVGASAADPSGSDRIVLIGASPEMLVRLEGSSATVRPIAGTRPRGVGQEADDQNAATLLADPKERAEHIMLVDLGRNDLGRVCAYGTVRVNDFMTVERYSHVMHIVSNACGALRPGVDAYDLVRATFPAGTVSGAPKFRAMQIIEELECLPRGPYAGGVGYFGYNGNLDTCITIRTIWMKGDTAYIQAGAGIVADSDPATEWHETMHKARALGVAIEMAENTL
jgi:anthranilate synthase component 1